MILDDGGDATMLVHLGVQAEKAGKAPDPDTADSAEQQIVFQVLNAQLAKSKTTGPRSPTRSRASPRRPPPACTASTS